MKSPAKRVIFIGLDGASMEMMLNQVKWNNMPNVAKLLENGVYRPMIGTYPTYTPTGWTSVYTGAWTPTHGIVDWSVRRLGNSLRDVEWAHSTGSCRSEYVWNAIERAGKKPILVKVEMSWPPTVRQGIQVEGTMPGVANHHQIAGYHLFVGGKWAPRTGSDDDRDPVLVDPSALQDKDPTDPVAIKPASESWKNLPASEKQCLEVEMQIIPLRRQKAEFQIYQKAESKSIFGLIYASGENGYDRVRICNSRDAASPLADLSQGQWSDWWVDSFEIDGTPMEGNVRAKLITLSADAAMFELFVPQIWPREGGYTYPVEISKELTEKVGPFIQNPHREAVGLFDDDTYFECLEDHHNSLADVAQHLCTTRDWDALFIETHAPDNANHAFLWQADPMSGASPDIVKRCKGCIDRAFRSVDRFIGRILELADNETLVVITSDHGGTPSQFDMIEPNKALVEAGLLYYKEKPVTEGTKAIKTVKGLAGKGPKYSPKDIDWSRTRAVNIGLPHIFINLKGREPDGIVEPEDYEATQREIIHALLNYREPGSEIPPFNLALTREDAEMLNLWGDDVGDVIFSVHPTFDAAHGRQLPVGMFGFGGQHSTCILAGAGIRRGVALERQVRVVDLVPTACYLMGVPMPKTVEGGVIYEALEDADWHLKQ